MEVFLRPLICAFLSLMFVSSAYSSDQVSDKKFLVELFTSQGCSSCPTADRFLSEISQNKDVLALTMPVDIWDYLGWKDTLARKEHTQHQKQYAQLWGLNSVYTPQMVINARYNVPGTSTVDVNRYLNNTQNAFSPSLDWKASWDGKQLMIHLPANTAKWNWPLEVMVYGVDSESIVMIKRGENEGQTISYKNVVRSQANAGKWTGQALTLSVPLENIHAQDVDFYAIVVRNSNQVFAAKTISAQ